MTEQMSMRMQLMIIVLVLPFQLSNVLSQYTSDVRITRKEILTPQPARSPRINGSKIYGSSLGMKFIYRIPCQDFAGAFNHEKQVKIFNS